MSELTQDPFVPWQRRMVFHQQRCRLVAASGGIDSIQPKLKLDFSEDCSAPLGFQP